MTRVFGWALLMLLTGLATAWLRGVVDPLLPAGDWHGMLSGLFVAVTWPSLTWSLRLRKPPPCRVVLAAMVGLTGR
jgi:hypothetical protein